MAKRRSWTYELKARCEAVGWTVTLGKGGHYKVRTHNGRGFTFPSTPGDVRSERNALAEARRHGLDKLEERKKRAAEAERLRRIARDRQSIIGEALADAIEKQVTKEEIEEMTDKDNADTSLGEVDGVKIVEVAQAKHTTPISKGPRPLAGGEELLLEDGRVVYRCAKPAATVMNPMAQGICHRIFDTVGSLKAHISYHSRKTMPISPGERRKREREAYLNRIVAERKLQSVEASESASQQVGIIAQASQLADRFSDFKKELALLEATADELSNELRNLVQRMPEHLADEAVLDAARRYEQLRRLIG